MVGDNLGHHKTTVLVARFAVNPDHAAVFIKEALAKHVSTRRLRATVFCYIFDTETSGPLARSQEVAAAYSCRCKPWPRCSTNSRLLRFRDRSFRSSSSTLRVLYYLVGIAPNAPDAVEGFSAFRGTFSSPVEPSIPIGQEQRR